LPDETVRDVKERIVRRVPGASWTDLNLATPGSRSYLNNKSTLNTCQIGPWDRILITMAQSVPSELPRAELPTPASEPAANEFCVFVKTFEGRSITIYVTSRTTVRELKKEVQRMSGIGIEEQRLLYGGKQLDNLNAQLHEYNVGKQASIHMVGRMRGG